MKFLISITLFLSFVSISEAQVVRYDYNLRDVGMTTLDRNGQYVITMNPNFQRRMGPDAYQFFYTHEMAHARLRHLHQNISVRQAEEEADCWAARNSSYRVNIAVINYFRRGNGGSLRHGSSRQRIQRIRNCGGIR